jgi:hypothetical protein
MDEAPTQTQQQSQVIKNDSNQSQIKKTILVKHYFKKNQLS